MLRTNIEINEKVVNEAMKLTGLKTKKDVVNYALNDLVCKLKRKKIIGFEGKVEWNGNLSAMRRDRA